MSNYIFYLSIISSIISASVIPYTCYLGYQLYLNWNCKWITLRRRSIILCIYIILSYLHLFLLYTFIAGFHIHVPYILTQILRISAFFSLNILLSLSTLRVYLLYFDHEYNRVLSTNRWQILMDPIVEKTNWFIINRHKKCGDEGYLLQRVIFPLTILWSAIHLITRFSLQASIGSYHGSTDSLLKIIDWSFVSFSAIVSMSVAIVFWKRYPTFRDKFLIRKEIELSLKVLALLPVDLLAYVIVIIAFRVDLSIATRIIGQIMLVIIAWLMIIYPQRLKNKRNQLRAAKSVAWIQIISTKEGFESFGNFLEMEFSIENLLFLTEYIQLKYAILDYEVFHDKIKNELNLRFDLDLPHDEIPVSAITKEFRDAMDQENEEIDVNDLAFKAMHRLFEKYITESAALEVNISSNARKQLIEVFVHNTEVTQHLVHDYLSTILPLMETAAVEIGTLILDSHSRFKQKSVYHELSLTA